MEKTGIAVLDEIAFKEAVPEKKEERKPEHGRRPPKDGTCRRCGLDKPVNRVMLCYRCWVITEIEDREKKEGRHWTPGMAHPEWCRCEGLPEHPRMSSGN